MGLFSKLFSRSAADEPPEALLRRYIDERLPKGYTASPKYAVDIRQEDGGYTARVALDMTADGSDFSGFGVEDYLNLSELEGGFILEDCLADPPVPARFSLEMIFDQRGMELLREHAAQENGAAQGQ